MSRGRGQGGSPSAPLRVAHSFPEWLPQTQTWLYAQVRHTPAALVESHVVCERTANLDQFAVPNLHVLAHEPRAAQLWDRGLRKLRVRQHLGYLARVGRRHGVGVLHSHFGNVGWADRGAARRMRARHVTTFYGFDVRKLPSADPRWRARYAELFRSVSVVLCEGGHMATQVVALGCPVGKVRVHHLGVDVDAIEWVPRRWDRVSPLRLLVAASFREKKGITYALAAAARLGTTVPLEVTVVGDAGPDAESRAEKERIMAAVADLGLGARVRFLGYQPHDVLFHEAYQHHIFISPSVTAADGDTEGGAPVTLADLAATGMPIVSTTHCDIPEVVLHGRSGLLAPERDVAALAAHLERLAATPEHWAVMGRAGREHVAREYNVSVQGERLAAIYRDVCAE